MIFIYHTLLLQIDLLPQQRLGQYGVLEVHTNVSPLRVGRRPYEPRVCLVESFLVFIDREVLRLRPHDNKCVLIPYIPLVKGRTTGCSHY